MSEHERRREVVIGGGRRENYHALLFFLFGALLGMFAVYLQLNDGPYVPPLLAGLLCTLVAIALVAATKERPD